MSEARSALVSRRPTSLQQLVAGVVAERVVDLLEAVEVHDQHGHAAAVAAARPRGRVLDAVAEQRAVGQAGERVVQRLVLVELGLGERAPARPPCAA